jgi:hypothetical protein
MPSDKIIQITKCMECIPWTSQTLNPEDDVYIVLYDYSITAKQLLALLQHPNSTFTEKITQNIRLHLQVSFWILFEVRDESLGPLQLDKEELDIFLDHEYNTIPFSLGSLEEKRTLRSLLQQIPNLIVTLDDINFYNFHTPMKSCYVSVIRTFPNISDYIWAGDKRGWALKEHIWTCYKLWQAKTARIIRFHGSDDNCYIGYMDDECNFYETCQLGDSEPNNEEDKYSWASLANLISPEFRDLTQFMALYHIRAEKDCMQAMSLFPNLRSVRMCMEFDITEENLVFGTNERYCVIDFPHMPRLISLDIDLSAMSEKYNTESTFVIFRMDSMPNLTCLDIGCDYNENQKYQVILIKPNQPWTFISKQESLYSSIKPHNVLWDSAIIHGIVNPVLMSFMKDNKIPDCDIDAVLQ